MPKLSSKQAKSILLKELKKKNARDLAMIIAASESAMGDYYLNEKIDMYIFAKRNGYINNREALNEEFFPDWIPDIGYDLAFGIGGAIPYIGAPIAGLGTAYYIDKWNESESGSWNAKINGVMAILSAAQAAGALLAVGGIAGAAAKGAALPMMTFGKILAAGGKLTGKQLSAAKILIKPATKTSTFLQSLATNMQTGTGIAGKIGSKLPSGLKTRLPAYAKSFDEAVNSVKFALTKGGRTVAGAGIAATGSVARGMSSLISRNLVNAAKTSVAATKALNGTVTTVKLTPQLVASMKASGFSLSKNFKIGNDIPAMITKVWGPASKRSGSVSVKFILKKGSIPGFPRTTPKAIFYKKQGTGFVLPKTAPVSISTLGNSGKVINTISTGSAKTAALLRAPASRKFYKRGMIGAALLNMIPVEALKEMGNPSALELEAAYLAENPPDTNPQIEDGQAARGNPEDFEQPQQVTPEYRGREYYSSKTIQRGEPVDTSEFDF